jgi:hypothetical protein
MAFTTNSAHGRSYEYAKFLLMLKKMIDSLHQLTALSRPRTIHFNPSAFNCAGDSAAF